MTPTDTVLEILAPLVDAFPAHRMPDATAKLYAERLAWREEADLRAAIDHLISTATWMPTIGDINRAVTEIRVEHCPASPPAADHERECCGASDTLTPEEWSKLLPSKPKGYVAARERSEETQRRVDAVNAWVERATDRISGKAQ